MKNSVNTEGHCGDFSSLQSRGEDPCAAALLPRDALTFPTWCLLLYNSFWDPDGQAALGVTEIQTEKREREKKKERK